MLRSVKIDAQVWHPRACECTVARGQAGVHCLKCKKDLNYHSAYYHLVCSHEHKVNLSKEVVQTWLCHLDGKRNKARFEQAWQMRKKEPQKNHWDGIPTTKDGRGARKYGFGDRELEHIVLSKSRKGKQLVTCRKCLCGNGEQKTGKRKEDCEPLLHPHHPAPR